MRATLVLAALALLVPFTANADEAERGRALALRWCTACHVVAPDRAGGDVGPAFETLTRRSEDGLRAWLFAPHPPMPDLNLTAGEIDAILAYIRTLRSATD